MKKDRVPEEVQRQVFERDKYTCQGCKRVLKSLLDVPPAERNSTSDILVIDHVDGPDCAIENLQSLCWKCNSAKAGKGGYAFRLSTALRRIGRPMTYYPSLARIIGLQESIFLCQILYWGPRGRHSKGEGWIYKSSEEMEDETGLTYKQQIRIRKSLTDRGLLEEEYDRQGHRLFFRISAHNLDLLSEHMTFGHMPEGMEPHDQTSGGTCPKVSSIKGTEITTETTQTILPSASQDEGQFSLNGESSVPSSPKKTESDPRSPQAKKLLINFWNWMNKPHELYWEVGDAAQLKRFLKRFPQVTIEEMREAVDNYRDSEGIIETKTPKEFLPRLHLYLKGPLNQFSRPLEEKRASF